jgi:hypothetical protein
MHMEEVSAPSATYSELERERERESERERERETRTGAYGNKKSQEV